MTDRQHRQARATEEAAEWLLKLQESGLTTATRGEFVDWLRESPLHVAEMLRIARLRDQLSKFDEWSQLPAARPPDAPQAAALDAPPYPLASRWKWGMAAIAATVALAVGIYAFNSSDTVLRTQLGERREMALADGSEVALAPNTQLRIDFTSRGRSITLDYGEAFFHVSKDPNRPFIVSSAHARAQALGTSFSVEDRGDTAVVTVIEGRVAVKGPEPGTADVALGANQRITVSHQGTAPVRQVDGRVELAWSQGQLVFDNETVATIVSRFNDYNKLKIRVTDPSLAAQRISGVFRATDPESFVAFLESVDGLTARRDGATELVIESSRVAQPAVLPR